MGDSFIQLRACTGGLGPQGARQREEEEDVTNMGSDCVTTLIKMERAMEGMQKGNGETTVCRECQYRGQTTAGRSTSKDSQSLQVSKANKHIQWLSGYHKSLILYKYCPNTQWLLSQLCSVGFGVHR